MVAKVGEYFGYPFKGQCGVTQGGALSPIIFDLVVDAVLRHWVSVVAVTQGEADPGAEGFGQDIQRLVKYFYANNGILATKQAKMMKRALNVLAELFDQVGLHTNMGNMIRMVCQPCRAIGDTIWSTTASGLC